MCRWSKCIHGWVYLRVHDVSPHHDVAVDEALTIAGGLEVWILLSAGDPNVPHSPPSLIQLHVHRVHSWVVRGHGVTHVHWDVVLLEEWTYIYTHRHIHENCLQKHKSYGTFTATAKKTKKKTWWHITTRGGWQPDLLGVFCLLRCWPSGWKLKKIYSLCENVNVCEVEGGWLLGASCRLMVLSLALTHTYTHCQS